MRENIDPSKDSLDEGQNAPDNYLSRASAACDAGDALLGLHLYLAAFEQSLEQSDAPSEAAIIGLKQAWRVAYASRERALAEYIFERLEPYLSNDEAEVCAEQLQDLAFDRLEEFGISRDDIQEMSEVLSADLSALTPPFVFPSASLAHGLSLPSPQAEPDKKNETGSKPEQSNSVEVFTYDTLCGYGSVIDRMRALGIGLKGTPEFDQFIALLNSRHGLESAPAADCLLFCSPAREDASRFMAATVGELGLPAVRMAMEENFQGVPMLCVSAQAPTPDKLASLRHGFSEGGVLVLEDIDLWGSPLAEAADDMMGFFMAAMARGPREAISLIRQAVENPEVYVLASASSAEAIDPFFQELLFPMTCIEVALPTSEERSEIWMDLSRQHPSLRALDGNEIVRLSASMARYDFYMAVREAIEQAYKQGLVERRYIPVSRENLFDKLAAYQPLDSTEYAELEKFVVHDFALRLDSFNDLDELLG